MPLNTFAAGRASSILVSGRRQYFALQKTSLIGLQVCLQASKHIRFAFAARTTKTKLDTSAIKASMRHPCSRLGKRVYAQPLLIDRSGKPELGTLKQHQRNGNKVASEEEAGWRFSPPSTSSRDNLRALYKTQLPHFRALLKAVEGHPGFDLEARPTEDVPVTSGMTLSPSSKVQFFQLKACYQFHEKQRQ